MTRSISAHAEQITAAAKAWASGTSGFNPATRDLTLAAGISEAMRDALRLNISDPDLVNSLAPQIGVAASIREALTGSGILDQVTSMPDFAASLRSAFGDLSNIRQISPPDTFANITSVAEALRTAMPVAPVIDPSAFGGAWSDTLAERIARLRVRAEGIAKDPEATAADVEAFAVEAESVRASAPAAAQPALTRYVLCVLVWLGRQARDEAAKYVIVSLIVMLTVLAAPQSPPPAPPPLPPAAPVAPGDLTRGLPDIIMRAGPEAEAAALEFLASVRSRNTRDAYIQALVAFTNWCEDRNLELADITPFTIAAYVKEMEQGYKVTTVRQHLAAIRLLFDHLVSGQVVPMNPASGIRTPKGAPRKRNTAVLQPREIRRLLDSIDVSELSGLRDRAMIAVMVYGFARVSAVVSMDVDDYVTRADASWFQLKTQNGKSHEVPAHSKAREYLDAYLHASGIGHAPNSPLWRTMAKTRTVSGRRMSRVDVYRAVRRRADHAELGAHTSCQNLRAAGLTAYLGSGGSVKCAQAIAAHATRRTIKVYEPVADDEITVVDIERLDI